MHINSFAKRIFLSIIFIFIMGLFFLFLLSWFQLKNIIDIDNLAFYSEKIEDIRQYLEIQNNRLKLTGLVSEYEEAFKNNSLKQLRKTYYREKDIKIYPFILSTNGNIIMHPTYKSEENPFKKDSDFMNKAMLISEGNFNYKYHTGLEKWGVIKKFDKWNWIIGFAIPLNIKYERLYFFTYRFLAIMFFVIILAVILSIFITKRLTNPILKLTIASKAIASGNLEFQINPHRNDEIGVLSRNFENMRNSIKEKITKLNEEIHFREKIEEQLKTFKKFAESSSQGIVMTNLDYKIIYANNTFCDYISSENLNQIVGISIFKFYNKTNLLELKESILPEVLETGLKTFEMPIFSKAGKLTPSLQSFFTIYNENKEPLYLANIVTDITEQKNIKQEIEDKNKKLLATNEELQATLEELEAVNAQFESQNNDLVEAKIKIEKSERRFRTLVEATNDWFWEVNKESKYIYASPRIYDFLGYTPEEIIGKTPFDLMPDYEAKRVANIFNSSMELNEKIINLENINLHKNGNEIILETSCTPIFDKNKNLVGYRGIDRNITQRKKSEEALIASTQRLALHVEQTPLGVIDWDLDFNIKEWNKSAERIFGYSQKEAIGKHANLIIPEVIQDPVNEIWQKIKSNEAGFRSTNDNLTKDGKIITCEWYNTPLISNNKVIGITSLVQDITEQKKSQELLIQTEKMMTIGSLAAGMAHEINNPLGIILQGIQVVQHKLSPSNKKSLTLANDFNINLNDINKFFNETNISEYLTGIKNAGQRAAEIVSNMLKFSRKSHALKESSNINQLIDDALKLASKDYDLDKNYDFKNIQISKNYSKDLPLIYCIATEIEQVFLNIIKNAAQAMTDYNKDNSTPEIIFNTYQEKKNVTIEIIDNGPGINKTTIKHLFEPFYTTKNVGKGTGLGMSVSYFIITTNHKGTISVESKVDKGAKFIIKLPIE